MKEEEYLVSRHLHRYSGLLLVLTGYGLVELILFFYHAYPLASGETDGIGYMTRAMGPWFQLHPFHGIGYSWALRPFLFLGMEPFVAAKMLSSLCGVGFVAATWMLVSQTAEKGEALLAVALVAFSPILLARGVLILSDTMGAAFFLACLGCIMRTNGTGGFFVVAGLLGGGAYLTRHVYILALLAPWGSWALTAIAERKYRWEDARNTVLFTAAFTAVALPWWIFVWGEKGNPLWNLNYLNIAFKMYRGTQGWNAFPSQEQFNGLGAVVASDPLLFFRSWASTLWDLPWAVLKQLPKLGLLGAIGALLWMARPTKKKLFWIGVCALYGGAVALVWIEDRFLLPLLPFVGVWVARAVFALPEGPPLVCFGRKLRLWRTLAIACLVGVATVASVRGVPQYFEDKAPEFVDAGRQLHRINATPGKVLSAKPHVPFFGGGEYCNFRDYDLQDRPIEELPETLRASQAAYWVFDERYAAKHFPQYAVFLDADQNPFPALLQLVVQIDAPKRVVVYRVSPAGPEGR